MPTSKCCLEFIHALLRLRKFVLTWPILLLRTHLFQIWSALSAVAVVLVTLVDKF